MEPQRLADDLADPVARVERRVGVLEDHLHLAAQRLHLAALQARRSPGPRTGPSPRWARRSWRIARHRVDLPQPDSPTRPSVSPSLTVRLTPSTARTRPTSRSIRTPGLDREVHDEVLDLEQALAGGGSRRGRHGGVGRRSRRRLLEPDVARCRAPGGSRFCSGESQQRSRWPASPPRSSSAGTSVQLLERVRAAGSEVAALGGASSEGGWPSICASRGCAGGRAAAAIRAGPTCRGAAGRRRSDRGCRTRRSARRT